MYAFRGSLRPGRRSHGDNQRALPTKSAARCATASLFGPSSLTRSKTRGQGRVDRRRNCCANRAGQKRMAGTTKIRTAVWGVSETPHFPLTEKPVAQHRLGERLIDMSADQDVDDERLWMKVANLTGAAGTPRPSSEPRPGRRGDARYCDLGITTLLLKGFDPLVDAIDFGKA